MPPNSQVQAQQAGGMVIALDFWKYLTLIGAGNITNTSFKVAANATVRQYDNPIVPNSGDQGVFIHSLQFDGVNPGMVAYDLTFEIHEYGGYAVNAVETTVDILNSGSLTYQIVNTQSTTVAVNIIYMSLSGAAIQQMINSPLYAIIPGGQFGISQA